MPPKKIVKTLKTKQEKATRRRPRKEKCLPTCVVDDDPKVFKLKKNDLKVMLANEVVRRQFKKKTTMDPADKEVSNTLKQSIGKINLNTKAVLKRKCPSKNNKVEKEELSTCVGEPIRKKARYSALSKKSIDLSETVQKCDPPKAIDVTVPVLCKNATKKPIKLRRNRALSKKDTIGIVANNVTTEENLEAAQPKTKVVRRKLTLKPDTAKGRPRTRKKVSDDLKESQLETVTLDNVKSPITTASKPENITPQTGTAGTVTTASKPNTTDQDILDVRRASVSSELSWTKDISSSSTTTCVTVRSNDFVRIDKRIPIVKLTCVDRKIKCEENNNIRKQTDIIEVQPDNITGSAIRSFASDDKRGDDEVDFPYPNPKSPNLSSSSSESFSNREISGANKPSASIKLSNILDKLSSKIKIFDLEIINWIGSTNENTNPSIEKIQEKLYQDNFLKDEMNVLIHCQNIKRILCEDNQTTEAAEQIESKITDDNVIQTETESKTEKKTNISEAHNSKDDDKINCSKESLKVISNIVIQRKSCEDIDVANNKYSDNRNFISCDEDDEDALSLFAESITGIEPTKNTTLPSKIVHTKQIEEYVPRPVDKTKLNSYETITYNPTKISNMAQSKLSEEDPVIVCEKQSADSTSAYKEQDVDKNLISTNITYAQKIRSGDDEQVSANKKNIMKSSSQNQLMGSLCKQIIGVKSVIFKGVCFYNLISKCKKNCCIFPHTQVSVDSVKMKLKTLNEISIIQEYMLVRNWPGLRQVYGLSFVEEFVKRDLTPFVIEVAFDFVIKNNNKELVIHILEYILLYLNKIDLNDFVDLLMLSIKSRNTLLCDVFINTIAESQNFSRFKSVFIKLTDLMYREGRRFGEYAAELILERVVILPYEEGLARALIKIIRNTDTGIYSNSMIGHLEMQLLTSNIVLYEEFITLKNKALKTISVLDSRYSDVDRSQRPDKDIRCSPDTTNLDNMNKPSLETKFTRTIDFNKLNLRNANSVLTNLNNGKIFSPKNGINDWVERNISDNTRSVPTTNMRPPLRPPFKGRPEQKYGGPSKFQRRKRTNFF